MPKELNQAQTYYKNADELAGQTTKMVSEAQATLSSLKKIKERLEIWRKNLANAPITFVSILFLIVAVVEFVISMEIYKVIIPWAPWALAAAFFLVGLQLSHWLAEKLIKSIQDIKFSEYRSNPQNDALTDEEIRERIRNEANTHFLWGIIGTFILLAIISALAYWRVKLEIEGGIREVGFGIFDAIPIVLYIFEILFGMFFITLLQMWNMKLKIRRLSKKLDTLVNKINDLTSEVIRFFNKAIEKGFDVATYPDSISDEIQTAFYREAHLSLDEPEKYLETPQKKDFTFIVKLIDSENNPLSKHIHIVTHYKERTSGTTDTNGTGQFIIHTFDEDFVQTIFIGNTANDNNMIKIDGVYPIGEDHEHIIRIS